MKRRISYERLKQLVSYDPNTGLFTWLVTNKNGSTRPGKIAGNQRRTGKRKGRVRLRLDNQEYAANVIAFFYMTGRWTNHDVDHKDGDHSNNRWTNLREATRSQNVANKKNTPHSSPYKGITWDTTQEKWRVGIKVNGHQIPLGYYIDLEIARQIYTEAAIKHFGEFACFRDETIIEPELVIPKRSRSKTTPYKGVRFDDKAEKWSVHFGRWPHIYLGHFDEFETARRIYDEYAAQQSN